MNDDDDAGAREKPGNPVPSPARPLEVIVWGAMACFTRPEAKAERMTYPVPTPSAARGICEAIFWKPEFRYRVREIHVLKPIRYASFLRNEITDKMPDPVRNAVRPIDIMEKRTQRHTLALLDVAYRFLVDIEVRPGASANEAAYRDQFRRRVQRGECFHRPCLGCREFVAHFGAGAAADLPPDIADALRRGPDIDLTQEVGMMLFDLAFVAGGKGANVPLFFEAKLDRGVLRVPDQLYDTLDRIVGPLPPRPPKGESKL